MQIQKEFESDYTITTLASTSTDTVPGLSLEGLCFGIALVLVLDVGLTGFCCFFVGEHRNRVVGFEFFLDLRLGALVSCPTD